jgi:hypothetical protein
METPTPVQQPASKFVHILAVAANPGLVALLALDADGVVWEHYQKDGVPGWYATPNLNKRG